MAVIAQASRSVFRMGPFAGLNESPAGDAGLGAGEAAEMVNFRVTREGDLQVRPGVRTLWRFSGPVEGLWSGELGGRQVRLAAAGGSLWRLGAPGEAEELGRIGPGRCAFFGFGGKLYILTPKRYLVWTGYGQVQEVAGYRPVVMVSAAPAGGGTPLEGINRLTGARRGFYSPDGAAQVFQLPDDHLLSVDYAVLRGSGAHLAFTADLEKGTVRFASPPAEGVNTLEIGWTARGSQRGTVMGAGCRELFSGATDNRVFLYGNGTNEAYFSGVDYDGTPSAEYFPEGNVVRAGSENTPITGMIRHGTQLLAFKPDGAFALRQSTVSLASGQVIPAFYLTPLQREVGNEAVGQVSLVDNDPWTLWRGGVYRWRAGSYAQGDERVAQRVSQRVERSLGEMALGEAVVFDDQESREWYVSQGETTLVYNYQRDVWYRYESFPARCYGVWDAALHIGTADGRVCRVSRDYRNDDGAAIRARWCSGAMDMGRAQRRRWGRWLWVTMKPESGGAVTVSTRTDRRSRCPAGEVRASLANYRNANYAHWSFCTNRQPRVGRVRRRMGPAVYEQIVLESQSASETATVLALEGNLLLGRYAQ